MRYRGDTGALVTERPADARPVCPALTVQSLRPGGPLWWFRAGAGNYTARLPRTSSRLAQPNWPPSAVEQGAVGTPASSARAAESRLTREWTSARVRASAPGGDALIPFDAGQRAREASQNAAAL